MALSDVGGTVLHKAALKPLELIGCWLFLAERLGAFRRHQILYRDCKPANILVQKKPLRVTLIDFNYATAASSRGVYPAHNFGYTAGFQAPEHGSRSSLTEQSVVYQLGMVLAHCWAGLLAHPRTGLDQLVKGMKRMGAPGLADLLADCLASRFEDRPRNYEEVLRRIHESLDAGIPPGAIRVWKTRRAPYAGRLAEVGLTLES